MQETSGNLVSVNRSRSVITYQIHEKSLFLADGYKCLQKNYKIGFLKCDKGVINGTLRLNYDVSQYVSLAELLPKLNSTMLLRIMYNLLSTAQELREFALFRRENISLSLNDIFVQRDSGKTFLIYLPLNTRSAPNAHMEFEKKLRAQFVRMVNDNRHRLATQITLDICKDLVDPKVSLQEIINKINIQDAGTSEIDTAVNMPANLTKIFGIQKHGFQNTASQGTAVEKGNSPTPSSCDDIYRHAAGKSYDENGVQERKLKKEQADEKPLKKPNKSFAQIGKTIAFVAAYCVGLAVIFLIVFNYYRNSGLTVSFVGTMFALILFALIVPVLYFTRGNKKSAANNSMYQILQQPASKRPLVLVNDGGAIKLEFFIEKSEFVIGKAKTLVDGVIPFDKSVSDTHCKIVWDEKYYIKDLDSEFGTFVNGDRVNPGQAFPIYKNDRITIGKQTLTVKII